MKLTQALNVAVAGLLVVPAVTLQSGGPDSLREALDGTVRALETLAGLDQRLAQGAPVAIDEVLARTEPPLAVDGEDPTARERLLESLREQVAALQSRVDRARRALAEPDGDTGDGLALPIAPPAAPVAPPTTGLDDAMRALLATTPPRPAPVHAEPLEAAVEPPAKTAFEGEGFTASALLLGQAYYRKGDYDRALEVLGRLRGAEPVYWRARSLEKLGHHDEALEAYAAVAEAEGAGPLATRAQEDIEFLQWRLEFERKAHKPR